MDDKVMRKFEAQLEKYAALPPEEKHKVLRDIGILGADNKLTTRYGGTSPVEEAVLRRERERQGPTKVTP